MKLSGQVTGNISAEWILSLLYPISELPKRSYVINSLPTSKCCEKSCHFYVCIQTIFTSKLMQDTEILKMHLLLAKAGKVFFQVLFWIWSSSVRSSEEIK